MWFCWQYDTMFTHAHEKMDLSLEPFLLAYTPLLHSEVTVWVVCINLIFLKTHLTSKGFLLVLNVFLGICRLAALFHLDMNWS